MARDRGASGRPLHNEKPRLHSKMQTGSFMLSPLARLLHLTEKRRSTGFVPAAANLPAAVPGGIRLWFHAPYSFGDNATVGQASAGSASTPECGPPRSVQRIGQGRFVILYTRAFELLLGFPEARDAGCDFGPVARESFFLLRHRPSVPCLIRACHHWRARMGRECGSEVKAHPRRKRRRPKGSRRNRSPRPRDQGSMITRRRYKGG